MRLEINLHSEGNRLPYTRILVLQVTEALRIPVQYN